MASLRFEIRGELGQLTLRSLHVAIDLNLRMLGDYDRGVSKQRRGTLEWVVANVSAGSVVFDVQSYSRVPNLDVGPAVVRHWEHGWKRIEEAGETPPYLTWSTMQKARQVTRLIGTDGVFGFVAATAEERTEVTARASAHMEQLVTVRHHALGSVEGVIETISIHGGKHFVVYDSRTNKAIACRFDDDEWLRMAAQHLGRRVAVLGTVHSNAKGEPVRVDAQSLRVFRTQDELPTAASLTGSDPDFTGGVSTEEFLRQIRSA
jgi:hypothetical protein